MDKPKKNGKPKKRKFFMCFRPIVHDPDGFTKPERGLDGSGSVDPVYTCIAVEKKEAMVLSKLLQPEALSLGGEDGGYRRKKGASGRFHAALKAILFEASLSKKMNKKAKSREKSLNSSSARYNNFRESWNEDDQSGRKILRSMSSLARPSSDSFMCPSCSTLPFTSRPKRVDHVRRERCTRSHVSGLLLLLVSLFVLVFCGKFCAIICSSTCVFTTLLWVGDEVDRDRDDFDSSEVSSRRREIHRKT